MINKNELPKDWVVKKLGEVCEIVGGGTPSRENRSFFGGNILWLTPTEIDKVAVKTIFDSREKITELGLQKSSAKIIPAGSVLLSSRATIGNVAIAGTAFTTNQGFASFICPANLQNKFLAYWLKRIKKTLNDNAKGTTFKEISKSEIKNLAFPLPPLAEQESIVAKIEELFSELDAGVESLKTAQRQLKTYRQAVLKWAFEGRLTNENFSENDLPNGWKRVKVSDIAEVRLGRQRSPQKAFGENMCLYLRAANVTWDGLDLSDVKSMNFSPKEQEIYKLKKGDILLSEASGSVSEVGKPAVWNDEISNCCLQNTLIRVRPHNLESSKFLHLRFYFDAKVENFRKIAKGVGIHHLGAAGLSNWTIPFPPIEEQSRIVQEIESRLSVCDKLEETIAVNLKQAEALRQSILKKAFEGKLVKAEETAVYQPNNINFYRIQILAFTLIYFRRKGFRFAEMTSAKNAYLLHKIFGVPFYDNYKRWHLGPYSSEIKKTINNKTYFRVESGGIEVLNEEKLFKYSNPYQQTIEDAVNELAKIYDSFTDPKIRPHKIELLATVCKVVEDIQTTEIDAVRQSMAEWTIDLKNGKFKNKAEKFDEDETAKCVAFIIKNRWDKKLIRN